VRFALDGSSKPESSGGLKAAGLVLALLTLSSPMAKADLTGAPSYRTNWVTPSQKRIFTDTQGEVKAQMIVKRHIFEGGDPKTNAKLTIVRKGKLAGSDSYVSKKGARIVNVSGPRLIATGDQDEPAIRVQKQCYEEVHQYEYTYDDTTGRYKRGEPSLDASDIRSQPNTMTGFCTATAGNTTATLKWKQELFDFGGSDWKLQIKRGRRVIFTKLLDPPALDQAKQDKTPECFGPYVTTSIDPRRKTLVDLRMTRIVDHARLGCEVIYYYDRASRKMKCSTHEWGLNAPRLADLRADPDNEQIDFVTEDWSLSKPDMSGPLQIWEWGKSNKLVNVTKQFPNEIKRHSLAALAALKSEHTRGNLLAYIGDLCLLNRKKLAIKELHRLNSDTETNDKITAQLKSANYI
jgi:hypothetical protein